MMWLKRFVLSLGGLLCFFRLVSYDGYGFPLFPRSPIHMLGPLFGTATKVATPMFHNLTYSWWNGDVSPHLLVACYLTLFLVNGFQRQVLWPSKDSCKAWRSNRFYSILLFVFLPSLLAHKYYMLYSHRAELFSAFTAKNGRAIESWSKARSCKRLGGNASGTIETECSERLIQPDDMFSFARYLNPADPDDAFALLEEPETVIFKDFKREFPNCPKVGINYVMNRVIETAKLDYQARGKLALMIQRPSLSARRTWPSRKSPVMFLVHGGSWKTGGPGMMLLGASGGDRTPAYLLSQGVTLISVQYRLLCTGADIHDMLEDLRDAVDYVVDNAGDLGVDVDNMAITGVSAGAHLSMLFSYHPHMMPQAGLIKGVVNVFGPTEMRYKEKLSQMGGFTDKLASWLFSEAIQFFGVCKSKCETKGGIASCLSDISPIAHVSANSPPTLTLHGHDDPLVTFGQAKALHDAFLAHNRSHTLVDMPYTSHGFHTQGSCPLAQAYQFSLDHFLMQVYDS